MSNNTFTDKYRVSTADVDYADYTITLIALDNGLAELHFYVTNPTNNNIDTLVIDASKDKVSLPEYQRGYATSTYNMNVPISLWLWLSLLYPPFAARNQPLSLDI